jgi:hypothetical protein
MQLPILLEKHVKPLTRWVGKFSKTTLTALDLARSDFHLFGKLKVHLSGKGFASDQEVENETRNWLTNLDANFYAAGVLKLVSCWNKCLNLFGDYVEKYVKSKLHFGMCIQKIRIKFSFFFSSVP